MKAVLQYLAIMAGVAVACLVAGCASCGTCRGSEPTAKGWMAVPSKQAQADDDEAPPPPAVARRGPHARPIAQADEFATPPTDGPDPNEPTDDEPEAPPAPKVRKTKGKTRLLKETDGGLVIEQHGSGAIYLNSPGAQPPVQAPAQAAVVAQAPLVAAAPVATPIIPGPFTDAQVFGIARRIGGGLYYAATGKCPPLKAKAAAVQTVAVPAVTTAYVQQTSYALVPQTTLAAVPVQTVAPVPVAAAPLQYLTPAATPLPPLPAAAPTPQTPLASPQAAPRKSLFGLGR